MTRYFYFQLVSVFLGSIIAGSLFSQLRQFMKHPGSIITILGVGIPMTATFFINYILVRFWHFSLFFDFFCLFP